MKNIEIKELTIVELTERIQTEQTAYNQMLLNHAVSPIEKNSQIKVARRNIARLKTVLRQKELNK